MVRSSSGNYVFLCFLLLKFLSESFVAMYLKPPNTFVHVQFEPVMCSSIIYLDDRDTTSDSRRGRAWGGICGGELLEPLLLSLMGLL